MRESTLLPQLTFRRALDQRLSALPTGRQVEKIFKKDYNRQEQNLFFCVCIDRGA